MNPVLSRNKLRVHYRVLQKGETATVLVAGSSAGGTVLERWLAWMSISRIQWVPAWLEGEQLEWALVQELPRSHSAPEQVAVDRVIVLRHRVLLQALSLDAC